MFDGGRIVGGAAIALFLTLSTSWFLSVRAEGAENPVRARASGRCIESASQMVRRHPEILLNLRTQAVRGKGRLYRTSDGREIAIGLTGTCLKCHGTASEFCDRCHIDVGVQVNCWGCHSAQSNMN